MCTPFSLLLCPLVWPPKIEADGFDELAETDTSVVKFPEYPLLDILFPEDEYSLGGVILC